MTDKAIHVVVRIPVVGIRLDTIIESHNAVTSSHGSVWFGVRGQAPSPVRWNILLRQIQQGIRTNLFVLQRAEQRYRGFRAQLHSIALETPQFLIPAYYFETDLADKAAFWINVGEFQTIEDAIVGSLHLRKTGTPLTEVLTKSMACVAFVS